MVNGNENTHFRTNTVGQLGCTPQWQIQEKKTSENGVSPTVCVCNGCNGYNALL